MVKLPERSENWQPITTKPFLSCMSLDSLAALDAALYFNHHRHIVAPAPEADIMPFEAAAEMSQTPHPEGSQWRK